MISTLLISLTFYYKFLCTGSPVSRNKFGLIPLLDSPFDPREHRYSSQKTTGFMVQNAAQDLCIWGDPALNVGAIRLLASTFFSGNSQNLRESYLSTPVPTPSVIMAFMEKLGLFTQH